MQLFELWAQFKQNQMLHVSLIKRAIRRVSEELHRS